MADRAILSLSQQHQTDYNYSCQGHSNHQKTNKCVASKVEDLTQGAECLLLFSRIKLQQEKQVIVIYKGHCTYTKYIKYTLKTRAMLCASHSKQK